MSLARRALLALSTSAWLRERASRSRVVRRSVSRFMPGERLDDALRAAREQQAGGMPAILTHLGENLTGDAQADAVAAHYLDALDRIAAAALDVHVSVKLTQLGLDADADRCARRLHAIVARASGPRQIVWIDMESSAYVDRTIQLFLGARERSARVGLALQAYLHRTADDLERLLPVGPAIRLVKGAYLEGASTALQHRIDVDERYYRLGVRLLEHAASGGVPVVHIATHDPRLVRRLGAMAAERSVPASAFEYAMLYGIQRSLQAQLVAEGSQVRVLIAYGDNWFPWYMRRLAERPANVWLLVRNAGIGD